VVQQRIDLHCLLLTELAEVKNPPHSCSVSTTVFYWNFKVGVQIVEAEFFIVVHILRQLQGVWLPLG